MAKQRIGWSMGLALVAACMLVLQSVTGALASGDLTNPERYDLFGNPLCISGHSDTGDDRREQRDLPDCCVLGCSMASPWLAAHEGTSLLAVSPSSEAVSPPSFPVFVHSSEHDPGSPRAPPLTA